MFEYLDKIREWAPVLVDLLILVVGACTALQMVFLFLGKWFPGCATIAHWLGIAALDLKQAADGVSKILGKGKDAAKTGTVALVLLFVVGCSIFTPKVARTALEEAARLLCVDAEADHTGVSAEDIRDAACQTREAWLPFLEAAIAAKRAGAVKAGMAPGPLTPENAVLDSRQ